MVVDGTIRMDASLPPAALIRILHADSTIAKTVFAYDPGSGKFGVRLSSVEGFDEDERILFRVVLSAQDSFIARARIPVNFKGSGSLALAPTVKADLFRNHTPQFRRQLPDTIVKEGQTLKFRLIAVDFDGDTIRYGIHKVPAGARLDPINGLFTWTPTYDQAGRYDVSFRLDDGYDAAVSRVSTVTVKDVNRAPVMAQIFPDTTIREGQTLRFHIIGIDPDGDPVIYGASKLPSGAVFDSVSGEFEWTPSFEQAGRYVISTTVLDNRDGKFSRPTTIIVLNVNRPPVFTSVLKDTAIDENQELRFPYEGVDPDGDKVRFLLASGSQGASVSRDGMFFWRPTFLQAGEHEFTVIVRDDSLETAAMTRVHVRNVNRLPSFPKLLRPADGDTVQLSGNRSLFFAWSKARDEDADDTLLYAIRIKGPTLDTTVVGIGDTSVGVQLRSRLEPLSGYTWTVFVTDGWATVASPEAFAFRTGHSTTSLRDNLSQLPKAYALEPNFPNPFNPSTTIRYALPERSFVKLAVYNMLGEQVQELVSGEQDPNLYEMTFNAGNLPSGVYLLKLEAHPISSVERKDFISTKKMILVK